MYLLLGWTSNILRKFGEMGNGFRQLFKSIKDCRVLSIPNTLPAELLSIKKKSPPTTVDFFL